MALRGLDGELRAMATIAKVLEAMGDDGRRRVLGWASDRYVLSTRRAVEGVIGALAYARGATGAKPWADLEREVLTPDEIAEAKAEAAKVVAEMRRVGAETRGETT